MINAFLSHLATEEGVSASTQNQALAELLFLYRTVLGGSGSAYPWSSPWGKCGPFCVISMERRPW